MSRNVNVTTSAWQDMGSTAACPQFRMTVSFSWTDVAGLARTFGPTVLTFPNVIGQMTAPERAWFVERMQDVLVEIARRRAGVDG